jgi:hypothetical protein
MKLYLCNPDVPSRQTERQIYLSVIPSAHFVTSISTITVQPFIKQGAN